MQSELKPCPFCGADFKMGQEPQDNHPVAGQFYLYHNYGPLGSAARLCSLSINRHFYTEAEAIAAWNTRASDAEITRLTEALRAAEEEKKALRHHWAALDKALADNIIETDQPHRVRWEGEWHYGPLADAYFAMTSVVRKLARQALAGAKP